MATVGEMVNALGAERAPAVTREIDYDDFRNCRLTYDELVAVYIGLLSNLRDLGIWDAEVLEGKLGVVAPDGAVYAEDIVLWVGDDTTFSLGAPGKRVRVIVLPAKEE